MGESSDCGAVYNPVGAALVTKPLGRSRATRWLDQLRREQRDTVGLAAGGQPYQLYRVVKNPVAKPTLASQGIDKNLAHQARTLVGSAVRDARET
jgi:hypothetical protein